MPDDLEPDGFEGEKNPGTGQPKGIMVSVVVILIAILIILVVYMNMSGQNSTAATAISQNPWSLTSFTDQNGTTTPVLTGTVITADFRNDGQLTGSGGCDSYSARYMVQDTLMVVSRVTTGPMTCKSNNSTLQEEQYYASLEHAYELRVHDRVLTIYGNNGKPLLVFTAPKQVG
jgi:heat shock protein HslJ